MYDEKRKCVVCGKDIDKPYVVHSYEWYCSWKCWKKGNKWGKTSDLKKDLQFKTAKELIEK